MRLHPPNLVQLDSPFGEHGIGDELGKRCIVDRQNLWNDKRGRFANFRQQVLNLSDPRKVFVIGAVLCQLQRRVVINTFYLQIERLFELKHFCQHLRRLPYSPLPLVKLRICPLHPGKILLPFADIGKKMRQVPLIRVGNISASWNFRFVHEEIVTRNALSSTGRPRHNPETSRQHWTERVKLASQPSQFQCFMASMKRLLILQLFGALVTAMAHAATNFDLAAKATHELAVDLERQLATGNENLCVSPYSIQSALAMTFAGADGDTRTEMARVLHFSSDASAVAASFASLQHSLEEM